MRPSSFLVLAVVIVLGALAVQAAVIGGPFKGQEADKGHVLIKGQGPVKGQHPAKGQGPVKTPAPHRLRVKSGSCPTVLIKCAMLNPPNACLRDSECPGNRKCCVGSCGMACLVPK